jgi:hypothetical protein
MMTTKLIKITMIPCQPLRYYGRTVSCATLHDAIIAWRKLPEEMRGLKSIWRAAISIKHRKIAGLCRRPPSADDQRGAMTDIYLVDEFYSLSGPLGRSSFSTNWRWTNRGISRARLSTICS